MVDVGKKKISIDMKINPFGEFRGKKAPDWFAARPKLMPIVKEIPVKKTMELNPVKWKKKVIEDGVYAVARFELAQFATALNALQKDIDKAIPKKEQKNKKFTSNTKDESKEEGAALSAAETKVKKLYTKIAKQIADKVETALQEIESDKGDNKAALKAGKEALKKFADADVDNMFGPAVEAAVDILQDMSEDLSGADESKLKDIYKSYGDDLKAVHKEYKGTAKTCQNVIKYLLHKGEKMAKDKDSDASLKNFGEKISKNGPVKNSLQSLSKSIDSFESELISLQSLTNSKASADAAKMRAKKFNSDHSGKERDAAVAVKHVKDLSKEFNGLARKLK